MNLNFSKIKAIQIAKNIKNIYKEIFKELAPSFFQLNLNFKDKLKILNNFLNNKNKRDLLLLSAINLSDLLIKENNKKWKKRFKKSRGYILKRFKTYEFYNLESQKEIFKHTTELITSIPKQILNLNKLKYIKTLREEVLSNTRPRGEFYKLISQVSEKYAKTIARTEAARIQAKAVEVRAQKLDCNFYIWISARDERTRSSHKTMNNVLVEWNTIDNKKPYLDEFYGNAGEFFNCRCIAKPVFDIEEFKDDKRWKFYNYRTKKIENINQHQLIKMLRKERGE